MKFAQFCDELNVSLKQQFHGCYCGVVVICCTVHICHGKRPVINKFSSQVVRRASEYR